MKVDRLLAARIVLLLTAIGAGSGWFAVFGSSSVGGPVVVAAAVPMLLALIPEGRAPTRILLPGLVILAIVLSGLLEAASPSVLADGLIHGWARVLDGTLPAPATANRLVIAPFSVGLAAAASAAATRSGRAKFLPLAPFAALILLERLISTRGSDGQLVPATVAVLVGGAVFLLLRVDTQGRRSTTLVTAAGTATLLTTAVLAALLPAATPYDVAAHRHPPVLPTAPVVNPLDLLQASAGGTEAVAKVSVRAPGRRPHRRL